MTTNPIPVTKIVTHYGFHPDEVAAVALALEYGGDTAFPGLKAAFMANRFEFVGAGTLPPDSRTAAQMEAEGYLAFGVWGGRFDEHATMHGEAKENETTTMLVARHLGIEDLRSLRSLFQWVTKNDNEGKGQPFDIASILRSMHDSYPEEQAMIFRTTVFQVQCMIRHLEKGNQAFQNHEKSTQVMSLDVGGERQLVVGIIRSDNTRASLPVRHVRPFIDLAIYIQPKSTRIEIFPGRYSFPNGFLETLAVTTRAAELTKRGVDVMALDEAEQAQLSQEGNVHLVPEWALLPMVNLVTNGTHTNPFMPQTSLSAEELLKIVEGAFVSAYEDENEELSDDEEGEETSDTEVGDEDLPTAEE